MYLESKICQTDCKLHFRIQPPSYSSFMAKPFQRLGHAKYATSEALGFRRGISAHLYSTFLVLVAHRAKFNKNFTHKIIKSVLCNVNYRLHRVSSYNNRRFNVFRSATKKHAADKLPQRVFTDF